MAHSSLAIANEFLKRAQDEGKALSHMHVQRLVYIAHGFNLAINHEPLVDEQFQAWEFGPIAPELYQALRRYGSRPVTRLIRYFDPMPVGDTGWSPDLDRGSSPLIGDVGGGAVVAWLSEPEKEIVDQVWNDFGRYEGYQLSALTTQDQRSPWARFYKPGGTEPIPNNSIKDYFAEFVGAHDAAEE
jgi:uncharacterized phage-associated protein